MAKRLTFYEAINAHLKTLERYVPVVSRVHAGTYPEFFEVQKLFNSINKKIREAETEKAGLTDPTGQNDLPDLNEEFARLREITHYYRVPHGVCESYEAVYKMLADLDNAYHTRANTA